MHHIDFPDYTDRELLRIAEIMLAKQNDRLSAAGREAMTAYIAARKTQSLFANARSIRNALDRARLRQANRVFASDVAVTVEALSIIEALDILASRVLRHTNGAAASEDSARSRPTHGRCAC